MAQGRDSAILATTTVVVLVMLLSQNMLVSAVVYKVGSSGMWTFNVVGWPQGKRFRAGDTVVFNYAQGAHNVVTNINKANYDGCTTPKGAKVYRSGKDQIKLVKGQNYFICNYPGHCESGMKIAIKAV